MHVYIRSIVSYRPNTQLEVKLAQMYFETLHPALNNEGYSV